jgi:F-type H+-transporting ATPase subunit epsilon
MATIKLDIVTAEQLVFSGDVDEVVAPGTEGQLGILPRHSPLMTMLAPGELLIKKADGDMYLSVSGGFLEVRPDRIIVLTDAAERADEINIERADAARSRAEEDLKLHPAGSDEAQAAEAALKRAIIRLKTAQRAGTRKRRTNL